MGWIARNCLIETLHHRGRHHFLFVVLRGCIHSINCSVCRNDSLRSALDNDIMELNSLIPFVEYEGILSSWIGIKGEVSKIYLLHVIDLSHELGGLHSMLQQIKKNKVSHLSGVAP